MILAIIQARMSSTRLPGKSLMLIHGRPMLWWVIEAARKAKKIDKVIVATSNKADDERIVDFASKYVDVFPGDLEDVLDRYYQTALCGASDHSDHIVRLTGDCPLLIPALIDDVIEQHLSEGNDYTWNQGDKWPSGFDVEVMTFGTLRKTHEKAVCPYDREHVTAYIRDNPDEFKIGHYDGGGGAPPGKWSIDTMADYERVADVFELVMSR